MRDYEELVSCLRIEAADGLLVDDKPDMLLYDSLRAAADAIEELSVVRRAQKAAFDAYMDKMPKWISVEERLPKFDQKVFVWVKNKDPKGRFNQDGIYIAELKDKVPKPDPEGKKNFWGIPGYDSAWTVWAWSYFTEPDVLYWMPLPEPPKEDGNA